MNEMLKFSYRYKKYILLLMLLSLISAILSFIIPFIVRSLLKNAEFKSISGDYILLFVLALVGTYLCSVLYRIFILKFSFVFKCEGLHHLFSKLLSVQLPIVQKLGPTYYTERILDVINKIFSYVSDVVSTAIVTLISIVIVLVLIFMLNKFLFLGFILLIPFNFLSYRRLNYQLQIKSGELQKVSAVNLKNVINFLQNIEAIKQFVNFEPFLHRLDLYIRAWQKKTNEVNQYGMLMSATINFLTECIKNGTLLFTIYYFLQNKMIIADVLFINLVFSIYFNAVNHLNRLNIDFRDFKAALDFISREIEPFIEKQEGMDELFSIQRIELDVKSFSYNNGDEILKSFKADFSAGEIIGIAGRVGSGKSTIGKLLLRFYDNVEHIKVNGKDIKTYTINAIRKQIYVIPQYPFIFPGTVKENIIIGLNSFDEEKFQKIVSLPFFSSFIKELPNGLNTEIGEMGFNLSGGQKQIIMIARSLMHNSSVIVFDESTSSVDSRIEEQIYTEIKSFIKDKIVIIISHRLATLKNCTNILVVKRGTIVAVGTHDDLVKTSDEYRKLFGKQIAS